MTTSTVTYQFPLMVGNITVSLMLHFSTDLGPKYSPCPFTELHRCMNGDVCENVFLRRNLVLIAMETTVVPENDELPNTSTY